jgi:hypothetical protein
MLGFQGLRLVAYGAIAASLCQPLAVRSATWAVSDSAWGTAAQANSFAWALAQADANPGLDTIEVTPGLEIDVDAATAESGLWLTTIREGLTIEGRGATLVGKPTFVTSGGSIYDKVNVDRFNPPPLGTDILTQSAYSFARIDPGVSLTINGLNTDGLNGYLHLGNGASAMLSNVSARNVVNYGGAGRSVFEALDQAVLSLTNVVLDRINTDLDTFGPAWEGAIAGTNSTLNMIGSRISRAASAAGAVVWSGGVANIVSSIIEESGGLSVRDDTSPGVMNLVNSLVSVSAQNSNIQRLQALGGGELNITASTILQDALYTSFSGCGANPYNCNGKPLTAINGGVIRLQQSVVSLINADIPGILPTGVSSYSEADLGYGSAGDLVALDGVWLQPTPEQTASALTLLFDNPALLTTGTPLTLADLGGISGYGSLPAGAVPNPSGPLVNAISDADGLNQLINPIDGSVLNTDLLGRPRSRQGFRDIGALQATAVPGPLPLAGAAAALGWSRRLRRRLKLAAARSGDASA